MYQKIKKQAFSLVEAMIAMAIFSMVATSLFGLYRYHSTLAQKLNKLKEKTELHLQTYSRLEHVFSKTIFETEKCHSFYTPEKKASFEHSSSKSLVFTFDNGTDREEGFSYDVLARLALTQANELVLFIWPNPTMKLSKPENVRQEILLEHVDGMKLEFWHPKNEKNSKIPKEKQGVWIDEWPREYKMRPFLTRLTLFFQNEQTPRIFIFISQPRAIEAYSVEGL